MHVLMRFLSELRRRNVVRTMVAYLGLVWVILQVVATVVPLLNMSPLVGSFFTIVLLAGIPVVFYIAWYFDITLHGLERITDDTDEPIKPLGPWRWAGLAVIVIGSGLLGFELFDQIKGDLAKSQQGVESVKQADSIAVMPFRDLSPDQDQAYLAEGLSEELTSLLGERAELSVSAFSSVLVLSQKEMTPIDIGRRLQVQTILSGSIRTVGDRLKLRLELIDTSDGRTLWTDNIQRKLTDIFAVESEVGRSVVNLLQDNYLGVDSNAKIAKTNSTDAYVIYLKGREQYRQQTTESMKQARQYFQQAIALDPEYAEAYVGLADSILMLSKSAYRFGVLEPEIAAQLAEKNLTKALVRDQNIARAYAIQGKVFELQQQNDQALSAYEKAISLNPNLAIAYMWRFNELQRQNRYDEALESLQIAARLDPVSIATQYNLGYEYFRKADYQKAQLQFEQLIKDFPASPMGYKGLAGVAYNQGHLADSLEYWKKTLDISPEDSNFQQQYLNVLLQLKMVDQAQSLTDDEGYQPTFLLLSGQYDELFKLMDFQLAANPDDPWIMFEAGWYQMLVGDDQRGITLLLQAYPLFSEQELYAMPYCSPAIEIAWALQQSEQTDSAQKLISQCHKQVTAALNVGGIDNIYTYLMTRIAALNNDPQLAIERLQQVVDAGWLEWWTSKDPLINVIKENPEAQVLFKQIEAKLQQQSEQASAFLQQQKEVDGEGDK
ncbi:tetratricopeptide repeat protein [Neptunicella sp.]|uniref:tetratricopeptide repeat protein n=1 Tax=Neptunicella sp. TaxID=2125986 RepID=UPI003F68FFAD